VNNNNKNITHEFRRLFLRIAGDTMQEKHQSMLETMEEKQTLEKNESPSSTIHTQALDSKDGLDHFPIDRFDEENFPLHIQQYVVHRVFASRWVKLKDTLKAAALLPPPPPRNHFEEKAIKVVDHK
jgi:hypothetical protein